MAISHYAAAAVLVLVTLCSCAAAQRNYYTQLLRADAAPNFFHPRFPLTQQSPVRRAGDECSGHPGASCMFILMCLMGGGEAAGPCPSGGMLSTCCRPRSAPATPAAPLRWPPVTTTTTTAAPVSSTTRRSRVTTVKPSKGNVTHCGIAKSKPQSRIIGGNDAMYGEFPWQAHIKLQKQQCGGVLLNNYYVMTAAHCVYQVDTRDIRVQLGVYDIQDESRHSPKPQSFRVAEKKVHPDFQYQAAHPDRYDVALLRLNRAARYHDNLQPVCLPRKDWDLEGWRGVITGWGKTDPAMSNRYGTRLLQKVSVPILSNDQCEEWHAEKGIDIAITEEMMCAGYEKGEKDACVGDSGGPLMVRVHGRWVVVGLVSAGFGCAQNKQPGIYHRVPFTVDWLRESIAS